VAANFQSFSVRRRINSQQPFCDRTPLNVTNAGFNVTNRWKSAVFLSDKHLAVRFGFDYH
jgi:hypothetical protein